MAAILDFKKSEILLDDHVQSTERHSHPNFIKTGQSAVVSFSLLKMVAGKEGSPIKPARRFGEHCKLPGGVRGTAPAENEFGAL